MLSDVASGREVNWGRAGLAAGAGFLAGLTLGGASAMAVTGTALTTGTATASFATVTGMGAAGGIAVAGLTAPAIEKALQSTSRIQHAASHLTDAGLLPNWSKSTMEMAKTLYASILSNPSKTVDYVLKGGEAVMGFLSTVDGKNVAVFLYKTGEFAGQIATSFVLTAKQLETIGL